PRLRGRGSLAAPLRRPDRQRPRTRRRIASSRHRRRARRAPPGRCPRGLPQRLGPHGRRALPLDRGGRGGSGEAGTGRHDRLPRGDRAPMTLPGTATQRKWASRLAIVAAIAVAYYLFTQVLDLESILESVSKALGPRTHL